MLSTNTDSCIMASYKSYKWHVMGVYIVRDSSYYIIKVD